MLHEGMDIKMNEQTGLPETPEGLVWRVREGADIMFGEYVSVQLVRPRRGWFAKVVTERHYDSGAEGGDVFVPGRLPEYCGQVLEKFKEQSAYKIALRARQAEIDAVVGMYPPKRFG